MKVKARIFQIIKWEEKESYFFQTDFGEEPIDLIHLEPIDEGKWKWYDKIFFISLINMFSKKKRWK